MASYTQKPVDIGDPQALSAAVRAVQQQAGAFKALVTTELPKIAKEVNVNVFEKMLDALRHYSPRKKGMKMRWRSQKQMRFVMMKLRKEKNLPYKRTGNLARGWKNRPEVDTRQGVITITTYNDAVSQGQGEAKPYQRFVSGDIGSHLERYDEPIQPFHKDRGWQPAQPIVQLAHTQATKRAQVLLDEGARRILRGEQ